MKAWHRYFVLALILAALALSARLWLPLFDFVGTNTELIQGLGAAGQILLWIGIAVAFLLGYRQRPKPQLPTHKNIVLPKEPDSADLRPKPSPSDLRKATKEHLQCLLDRHRYLALKGMGVADRIALRLPLLDLYVPLKARLELPEGETWVRDLRLAGRQITDEEGQALGGRLGQPQPVLDLLQDHDCLIILGDPGAGKTTFLKYLALQLALGQGEEIGLGERLPLLVPLSAYATALSKKDVRLDDFIADYCRVTGSDLPVAAMLTQALKEGTALALLDGLDEVKEKGLRNTVVERVVAFYTQHRRAGNKFVLTSRIVGYRAVRPVAEGLGECTLVDFEEDEIEAFVSKWTTALEKQAQGETATAKIDAQRERDDLLDAIQRNPGVRRLAANPLLLTILALMKRQGITLPERRVQLYDQYVRTLLSTWNRARSLSGRAALQELDEVEMTRILARLALWMHQVSPGAGLVKREDLRRKLESIYQERGEDHPEAAARCLMEDVREYAGLLLELGPGEYGFIHMTFEEYLAAVGIALQGQQGVAPIVKELSAHVGDAAWREVSLLTVGHLGIIQQRDEAAGAVVETLVDKAPGPPGEAVVLAGEAVVDAWPSGVSAQSKNRVIEALVPTMQDAHVPATLRRRAGLSLGRLGWLPDDLDAFVEVPPGKFLYGDKRKKREISYRYWIARYPVTNAQYGRFVADHGYDRQEFWSEEGWAWCNGTEADLSVIEDEGSRKYYREWLGRRSGEKRLLPFYWDDSELSNPIFPVVGVNWFEAQAYRHWLSTTLDTLCLESGHKLALPEGYVVRLPGEEEWERAARGEDDREYPWGDRFKAGFANTGDGEETGDLRTTAVCTYPQGVGPAGAWDMAGNAWEWTQSRWSPKERYGRVMRGGSWLRHQRYARCASRYNRYIPDLYANDVGFRVVVSLANSGF